VVRGHGLYATPRDYLAFQRMLLAGAPWVMPDLDSSTVDAGSPTRSARWTSRRDPSAAPVQRDVNYGPG